MIRYPRPRSAIIDTTIPQSMRGVINGERWNRDPIKWILMSDKNIGLVQSQLTKIIKDRMGVDIPPQDPHSIRDAIALEYDEYRQRFTKIAHDRSADIKRRELLFEFAFNPYDPSELDGKPGPVGNSYSIQQKPKRTGLLPTDTNAIKRFVELINRQAMPNILRATWSGITKKLRVERAHMRPFADKVRQQFRNRRGTAVIRRKEIGKYNGGDHFDHATESIRRYMKPQFLVTPRYVFH